jgi:hypothetical protein
MSEYDIAPGVGSWEACCCVAVACTGMIIALPADIWTRLLVWTAIVLWIHAF